jgi:hypothetical protein
MKMMKTKASTAKKGSQLRSKVHAILGVLTVVGMLLGLGPGIVQNVQLLTGVSTHFDGVQTVTTTATVTQHSADVGAAATVLISPMLSIYVTCRNGITYSTTGPFSCPGESSAPATTEGQSIVTASSNRQASSGLLPL